MENRRRRPRYEDEMVGCPPRWIWLLAGVLIGIFVSFLFYLREVAPLLPQENAPSAASPTTTTSAPAVVEASHSPKMTDTPPSIASGKVSVPADTESSAPRFEFYDLLPKAEVKVPSASHTELPKDDLPVTAPGNYLLQVGLFREKQPAEGLQTHLANLGVNANIGMVSTPEGEEWYRVQVGPFADLEELNRVRAMLSSHDITGILLKF